MLPMPLTSLVLKCFTTALKVASSSDWLFKILNAFPKVPSLPVQLISPRAVLKALSTVLKFVWPSVRLSIKQKQSESLNTCSAVSASSPLDNNYRGWMSTHDLRSYTQEHLTKLCTWNHVWNYMVLWSARIWWMHGRFQRPSRIAWDAIFHRLFRRLTYN
jgi:hypothetical protein